MEELGRKRIVRRKAFSFGSYGWSGGTEKELADITERLHMKWHFLEPVRFKGYPGDSELSMIHERGRQLASMVKNSVRSGSVSAAN
jgi:flavorubredoxin